MDRVLYLSFCFWVREHALGDEATIHAAVGQQSPRAQDRGHSPRSFAARPVELGHHLVGVDDRAAGLAQPGSDRGLAAGEAAGQAELQACRHLAGLEGVGEEHGDGEGADAARDRSDRCCPRAHRLEIDVADQALGRAVDADVDHHRAFLDVIGADETGTADGDHQDVGLPADRGEIARARVADGDGRVLVQEQCGHGLADERAAAHDHRVASGQRHRVLAQQPQDAGRRRGHEAGLGQPEPADVSRVEPVDVFARIDPLDEVALRQARRQRQLDQDSVHSVVNVEGIDVLRDLVRRSGGRQPNGHAENAHFGAGPGLRRHVDARGGVVSHQEGGQSGRANEAAHSQGDLGADASGQLPPIEDAGTHAALRAE